MKKKLSLLLAALFLAGSVQTAWANDDDALPPDQAQIETDADDDDADEHPLSLGHPGLWHMGHGPAMMPGRGGRMGGMQGRMGGRFEGRMGGPGRMMGRGGHRGDRAFGFFGMPMIRDLDLSADQKNQVVDAMVDVYRQRLLLQMQQDEAFQKLRKEYESGKPNRDVVVDLNRTLGELKGKLDTTGHDYVEKLQSVLTTDQQAKVKEHLEDIAKRFKERREGRRGGPDGRGPGGPKMMRGPGPRVVE